jgi:endonuclease/exonuclease/phosphatase family metal-dependent hydrolase
MRLLSYNIHKGIGGRDRRYDLDRIVRVIEHENPDLICLQEVTRHARRTRHDDQPHLLADAFAIAHSAFQMNVHYRRGGYGNLILSRWPFVRRHHVSLRKTWRKPRGGQLVVVGSPEGEFHLAHWHLGLSERERRWQVEHLLKHALFHESAHLPTLLVGDCNDWRNRLAAGPFTEHGFTQVTAPPSKFRSFPAFLPALSLDKAFHRGLFIREARVVRTPLSHRASDHLPLVVDFHLHEHHLSK